MPTALPNAAAGPPNAADPPEAISAHLAARGVAVDLPAARGRRQRILQHVDLSVPKGSLVSLIGPLRMRQEHAIGATYDDSFLRKARESMR
jgi:hypothetical protein